MGSIQDFQDLLNQLRETAPDQNDMQSSAMGTIGGPKDDLTGISNNKLNELLDQYNGGKGAPTVETDDQSIRNQLGINSNSKRANAKVEKMARKMNSKPGVSSEQPDMDFLPPENAPTQSTPPTPEETGFKLVPKDVYKLRQEAMEQPYEPDAKQQFHSEAAAKNPLEPLGPRIPAVPETGGIPVGESYDNTRSVPAVRIQPGSPAAQNISQQSTGETGGLPKVMPEVLGEGTSRAKFEMPAIEEGQILPRAGLRGAGLTQGLMASAPFAAAELANKGIVQPLQEMDKRVESGEFKMSPEDLAKVGYAGFGIPKKQGAGIPWNPPAGLMNNKAPTPEQEVQETTPPSDVNGGASSQAPQSRAAALLNAYRDLASQQGTGLREAQDRSNQNNFYANLGKAANLFTSGVSGTKVTGPAKVNNEPLDSLLKTANMPVSQYNEQVADQKHDPSSKYSQMMREFLAPKLKSAGIDIDSEQYKNTPADSLETVAKYAEQDSLAKLKQDYVNAIKGKAGEKKQGENEDKALQQTTQLIESARGSKAVQQAESDIYAAQKARSLATLYGDPNNLNPQMVKLLSSEIAKIAQGGSPTMEELKGLTPQTLHSRFANIWQQVVSSPTPANVGKFIKQYMDYADALEKDAQKEINNRYGRIIETNKDRLGDRNYKHLQENYTKRFENEEQKNKEEKQTSGQKHPYNPGDTVTLKNGKSYKVGADGDSLEPL